MFRFYKIFFLSSLLSIFLWLTFTHHVLAVSDCNQSYTIQVGDTLSGISVRFGLSMTEIVRLNNISNPNWIFVNQVLCLYEVSSPAQSPAPIAQPKVALEATFQVTSVTTEQIFLVPQKETIGSRTEFPLTDRMPVIITSTMRTLTGSLSASTLLLWVAQMEGDDGLRHSVLILPDPSKIAPALFLSQKPTQLSPQPLINECTYVTIGSATNTPLFDARLKTLTIWLEAANGRRIPFAIEGVTFADFATLRDNCFDLSPQFALFSTPTNQTSQAQLIWSILLDIPPGPPSGETTCEELRRGGFFSQLLADLQGCP